MKLKILTLVFVLFVFLSCNKTKPLQIASVRIKFEGLVNFDLAHTWIIKTQKNDTFIYVDTIELQFKVDSNNGNYLIFADSIREVNLISDVNVNEAFTFSGRIKTEMDKLLIITR